MQEKKLLSIEEIESQTLLALPDRSAMQVHLIPFQQLLALIFNLGGGGAGGSSGGGGGGGAGGGGH